MAEFVVIDKSVGRRGTNLPGDVIKIGAALTAVGPDRGGIYAPPLSVEGLAEAIEMFQRFQKLPVADGRVDPGGNTLRRINAVLNGGVLPIPPAPGPTPPMGTGTVRRIPPPDGTAAAVSLNTWGPVEQSLTTELVFKWTGVAGSGTIQYFELGEDVVPNWFGVIIPNGVASTQHVNIFFHPTPSQAGYQDGTYRTKGGWNKLFHYMSDPFAAQFCSANTGQVLIMPLMTQSAASTCGVFPQKWESIVGQILGLIAAGPSADTAAPMAVSSVVVSSFSSGITYSANFRSRAGLGPRLSGIIDFDGIISTYSHYSTALPMSGAVPVIRMQQTDAPEASLPNLARQNLFPLPYRRWGGPYAGLFAKSPKAALLQIHGTIPQTMMAVAAGRTRAR